MAMLADRVKQTSATTGTADMQLISATGPYQNFIAAFGTGTLVYYTIFDGTNWEEGYGTITAGTPDVLSRSVVLASSAGGTTKVSFPAGTKTVACTLPAAKFPYIDNNNVLTIPTGGISLPNGAVGTPSLSFAGQATTGAYYTAGQFNVAVGGSQAAYFNASNAFLLGNTLIGTGAAGSAKILSINGGTNFGAAIYLQANSATVGAIGAESATVGGTNALNSVLYGSWRTNSGLEIGSYSGSTFTQSLFFATNNTIATPAGANLNFNPNGAFHCAMSGSTLQYVGTDGTDVALFLDKPGTSTGQSCAIYMRQGTANTIKSSWTVDNNGNAYLSAVNAWNFYQNGANRMIIDSSGNVLIYKTGSGLTVPGFEVVTGITQMTGSAGGAEAWNWSRTGAGTMGSIRNGSTVVGSISITTTTTAYNTTSDYRLKTGARPLKKSATDTLMNIPVYSLIYKGDPEQKRVIGLFAHELQEHMPEAVTGEKDAYSMQITFDADGQQMFDDDGNPVMTSQPEMQQVDYSKLSIGLLAMNQEQQRTIESQGDRITALEAIIAKLQKA